MISRVLDYIPSLKEQNEIFYVTGLKLPCKNNKSCLSSLISNYYTQKENIVVFTSAFGGKYNSIQEISKELVNCKIFTKNDKIEECDLSKYQFLIFYNVSIPFDKLRNISKYHISAFYDYQFENYENIENTFKNEYIEDFVSNFPEKFIYTIICKSPQPKKINFEFGTDHSIKYICLASLINNDKCLVYSEKGLDYNIDNLNVINEISPDIKAKRIIFYDINVSMVFKAIKNIDDIVIIYTKDDFEKLNDIVQYADEYSLGIPEHIRKIAKK